ncbi:hypothetical protein ACVW0J_002856 [Bradyrhizobium sp. i1.7.7]
MQKAADFALSPRSAAAQLSCGFRQSIPSSISAVRKLVASARPEDVIPQEAFDEIMHGRREAKASARASKGG